MLLDGVVVVVELVHGDGATTDAVHGCTRGLFTFGAPRATLSCSGYFCERCSLPVSVLVKLISSEQSCLLQQS